MTNTPSPRPSSPEAFVQALVAVVLRAGFRGHLQSIKALPGRRPPTWLTDLSIWLNRLNDSDRRHAEDLAWRSAVYSLQQMLAVLDGVIAIEGAGPKGKLVLTYERGGTSIRLNDPEVASLEEILRGELAADD